MPQCWKSSSTPMQSWWHGLGVIRSAPCDTCFFFFCCCSFWLGESVCVLAKLAAIVTSEGLQMHTQKHFFFFFNPDPLKKFSSFPTHRSPHGIRPLTFSGGNFVLVETVSLQLFWDTPQLASCLTIAIKGDGRERKDGDVLLGLWAVSSHRASPHSGLQSRERLFANIQ